MTSRRLRKEGGSGSGVVYFSGFCFQGPSHYRLARYIPTAAADAVLVIGSVGLLALLVWLLVGSATQLNEDIPGLVQRGEFNEVHGVDTWTVWKSTP
jgi:hypothetical protein